MISFKPEVRIVNFNPDLCCILLNASMWSNRNNVGVHISAIDDGTHGPTTFHGLSKAVDMNVDTFNPKDRESLYQYMRMCMPEGFDVIAEDDHVHVERDPKRPEMRIANKPTPTPPSK